MRKRTKLIAIITVIIMTLTSLSSCGLFESILGPTDTPSSGTQNGGGQTNTPPNDKEEDKNNPPANDNKDDENKEETPEKPGQTTEPPDSLSPEEEANMERYGYRPVVSNVMPAIYINTANGNNDWATKYNKHDKTSGNIDYVDASISVSACEEEYQMTNAEAEVKVRGNATLDYEKKPIRIKFGSKSNLLGLHNGEKFKNWVLLADYKDLSMSNNTAAFFLGNLILGSDGYYCTDFRNVEVYLNGVYWGVYLLVEQQEVKDGRTSVGEVEKNYTGTDIGYFFEFDGYYTEEGLSYLDDGEGDPTFTVNHQGLAGRNSGYTVKSDLYTKDQLNFLKKYVENTFYIAHQASKGNYYKFDANYNVVTDNTARNAKDVISSIIDIQSLVDIYILNEIACDLDVDWSSFYLSLDLSAEGSKRIIFEAPWDWDSCFGLRFDVNDAVPNAQGMYASSRNPWFKIVTGQDWFWEMVRAKWSEMKKYDVLNRTIKLIGDQKAIYADYYVKNYERWPNRVLNGIYEVNSQLNSYKDIKTAQGLAADFLMNWLNLRFTYLDSQWLIEGDRAYAEKEQEQETVNHPQNTTAYRFEAEDATLSGFKSSNPVRSNRYYASGGAYVSDMNEGASITIEFDVQKTTTIYIYISVAKRVEEYDFNSCFTVSVNGKKISVPAKMIPATAGGEDPWHSFACIRVSTALVGRGTNTITISAVTDTTNIDYIELCSSEVIK